MEVTGDVMSLIDPVKTTLAARSFNIPPLLCLACAFSSENGECNQPGVNMAMVKARWEQQLTISQKDYQESLKPDTPLSEICDQFSTEKKPKKG